MDDCLAKSSEELKRLLRSIKYPGRSYLRSKRSMCEALVKEGHFKKPQESREPERAPLTLSKRLLTEAERDRLNIELLKLLRQSYVDWIPLVEIICADLSQGLLCNDISYRIASNLLRIATTRVFNNPYRSFLELPLNSIDSYRKLRGLDSNIGRFGFGFLSVLYFLVGHPDRYIQIKSRTEHESYTAIIKEEAGELSLRTLPLNTDIDIGTDISFHLEGDRLPYRSIDQIRLQLGSLSMIPDVYIKVTLLDYDSPSTYYLYNGKSNPVPPTDIDDSVQIYLEPDFYQFTDQASGISLETLYTVLPVPSVSTKTINASLLDDRPAEYSVTASELNRLYILVNDVIIYETSVTGVGPAADYKLFFPGSTPLPISRDNIIFNDVVSQSFKRLCLEIIDNILESGYDLSAFISLLGQYEADKGAVQADISNIVRELVEITSRRRDIIPVNRAIPLQIIERLGLYTDKYILPLADYSTIQSELNILKITDYIEDIYWNKKVVFLKTDINTDGGLPSIFFLSTDYADKYKDLALSYVGARLYPYDTPLLIDEKSDEFYRSLERETFFRDDRTVNALKYLYLSYNGARENYSVFQADFDKIIRFLYKHDLYIDVVEYALTLQAYFSRLKPKVTYGQRPILYEWILWDSALGFIVDYSRNIDAFYVAEDNAFRRRYREYLNNQIHIKNNRNLKYLNNLLLQWLLGLDKYNYRFYRPVLVSEYLGFLSYFIDVNVAIDYLAGLINLTGSELLAFFGTLSVYFSSYQIKALTLSDYKYLMSAIGDKYPSKYLDDLYYYNGQTDADLPRLIYHPLAISLSNYLNIGINERILRPVILDGTHFTANALIDYVFNHEVPDGLTWLDQIETSNSTHQLVQIATSAGTEKDFIDAVLTELLQNSIDAIRLSNSKKPINVEYGAFDGRTAFSVTDYVGISDQGIISLLIPFYSTKGSNVTTGEYGTGFFNLYRQPWTKEVFIMTSDNERTVYIRAVPRSGDIDYSVRIVDESVGFKTTITVILNETDKATRSNINLSFNLYMSNMARALDVPIEYNGLKINSNKELLYDQSGIKVYYVGSINSVLYTNGTPFSYLAPYINTNLTELSFMTPLLTDGLVVDIGKGLYTSTQGRTSLQGAERLNISLREALMLSVCKLIVNGKYLDSLVNRLVPFFSATADYKQLSISNTQEGLAKFSTILIGVSPVYQIGGLTIADAINYIIRLADDLTLTSKIALLKSQYTLQPEFEALIVKWFSRKSGHALNSIIIETRSDNFDQTVEIFYNSLLENSQSIGRALYDKGQIRELPGFERPAARLIFGRSVNKGELGHYNSKDNTIFINVITIHPNLSATLKGLYREGRLKDTNLWREIDEFKEFMPTVPAKTLPHELGHLWRGTSHDQYGAHDVKPVTINGESLLLSFDEMTSRIYSILIAEGLFTKVADRMIRYFQDTD